MRTALLLLCLVGCSSGPKSGDWVEEISTGKRYKVVEVITAGEELQRFRESNFRRIEGLDSATIDEKEYLDARISRLKRESEKNSEIVRLEDFNTFYVGGIRGSDLVTIEKFREDFREVKK